MPTLNSVLITENYKLNRSQKRLGKKINKVNRNHKREMKALRSKQKEKYKQRETRETFVMEVEK